MTFFNKTPEQLVAEAVVRLKEEGVPDGINAAIGLIQLERYRNRISHRDIANMIFNIQPMPGPSGNIYYREFDDGKNTIDLIKEKYKNACFVKYFDNYQQMVDDIDGGFCWKDFDEPGWYLWTKEDPDCAEGPFLTEEEAWEYVRDHEDCGDDEQ